MDYLIVDAPPGTSDEHISIAQYLKATNVDGAIIVTTPQEVSIIDVRKEINFCKKVGIPVIGVVENMSGLLQSFGSLVFKKLNDEGDEEDVTRIVGEELERCCPSIKSLYAFSEVFHVSGGGAQKMAKDMNVPYLGRVPMDPELSRATEEGRSCFNNVKGSSVPYLNKIIKKVIDTVEANIP